MDRSCLKNFRLFVWCVFVGGHHIEVVQVCLCFSNVGFVGGDHCVKVHS